MKRLAHIAVLVVVTLLMACGNKEIALDTEPLYTPRYAQGFSIERDKESGDKYLVIKNPWQGAEGVAFYTKLDTVAPPKRIIAMSSSHSAMLEARLMRLPRRGSPPHLHPKLSVCKVLQQS